MFANDKERGPAIQAIHFRQGLGVPPGPEGVVGLDFNYDFKNRSGPGGSRGVRLLKQESANKFTDVTAHTKLPEGS